MRSLNRLALLAVAGTATLHAQTQPPADLPQGAGPRGTSQAAPGQDRYDDVGYAAVEPVGAAGTVAVSHRSLPVGSFVEVTALDSGRTVAAMVATAGPAASGRVIGLSPTAAAALGISGDAPAGVRVRAITPGPAEQLALRGGKAGGERLDAPPLLLAALRKRLPPVPTKPVLAPPIPAATPSPAPVAASKPLPAAAKPAQSPPPKKVPVATAPAPISAAPHPAAALTAGGTLYVQIAALGSKPRADTLAKELHGIVVPGNGLYRVRIGPYRDQRGAAAAREALAGKGYRDARIVSDH